MLDYSNSYSNSNFLKHFLSQVAYNRSDVSVGPLGMNIQRQAVIDYTYPIYSEQSRWFSRVNPISPYANLINTMDTWCWFLTFVSLVSVSLVLVIVVNVGTGYGVQKTDTCLLYTSDAADE